MSELNNEPEEQAAIGVADQIEERAAEWIEQRDFGDWNEHNQRELDAWLAQSIAHRVAFVRLDFEWQRTERLTILRGSEAQSVAEDATGRMGYFVARFSALMLFVAIIAGVTVYLRTPRDEIYATSVGGHKTVTFSDGSQIELNTDTVLRVNMADNRKVRLEKGEAYFQIQHDAVHPFVVNIADHVVTDLGTKFLLRAGSSGIKITLVEGRARIDSANLFGPKQSATLKAGDVAVATAGAISVARASTDDLANDLSWRRGMLVFHHATLEDAADQYNRYSAKHVVIADSRVGKMTFSATLPSNDVDTFVRVAEKLFNIHRQNQGDEIVISR